jgi:capsular exopolysaccharide synthesis family protein
MAAPIKRFLITLDKYKILPLVTCVLGLGGGGAIGLKSPPPPMYQAQGVLAISSPPTMFSATGAQIQTQGSKFTEDMLLSPTLFKEVVEKMKINPKDLKENLQIKLPKPAKKGEDPPPMVIIVSYIDTDEKKVLETMNLVIYLIIEQSKSLNTSRLQTIIKSINERLPKVEKDLRESEGKLEQYVRQEGPAIWSAQDGSILATINSAQQQQRQIQMTLGGVETEMQSLSAKLGMNPSQAYIASAFSADLLLKSLREQIYQLELQRDVLKRDLRSEHPTMIDLNKKLATYEQQLIQRAAEVIGNRLRPDQLNYAVIRTYSSLDQIRQQLANKLVTLQTQKETLQQQLLALIKEEQAARTEYTKLPNKQLEQSRLQQQVTIQQALYSKMQTSLADAKVAEAETVSSLALAQPIQKAPVEVKQPPSLLLVMGGGGFVGLALGIGLVFFLSTLDSILYTVEEIKEILKDQEVPLLGELPTVTILDGDLNQTAILIVPHYGYLQEYERVRSSFKNLGYKPLKVILITSPSDKEGKTITAYNLAIASAYAGKRTLLIEGDLLSPSLSEQLKINTEKHDKEAPLRYYGDLSECIKLVPNIENLYIVPNLGEQKQSAAILESSEFKILLEEARLRYDFIIIDSPNLSNSNDALLLEGYSDGIIMVARPEYSEKPYLQQALEDMNEAELPLLGVLINGVNKDVFDPTKVKDDKSGKNIKPPREFIAL